MNESYRDSHLTMLAIENFSRPKELGKWGPNSDEMIEPWETDLRPSVALLLEDRLLVKADDRASLDASYTATDLKKHLGSEGLKKGGSKQDLIDRLIVEAPSLVNTLLMDKDVYICTEEARCLADSWDKSRLEALSEAKQITYNGILSGNVVEAYREAVTMLRKYYEDNQDGEIYELEQRPNGIEEISTNKHNSLTQFTEEEQKKILAAIAMERLWRSERMDDWMPECVARIDDSIGFVARLKKHIEICEIVGRFTKDEPSSKFKIRFDRFDVDSCNLCRELDGKVMKSEDIPELPMRGCTSRLGCQCDFDYQFDYFGGEDEDEDEDEEDEYGIEDSDPVTRLRQLKQMLDESLITNEEYEDTKRRILADM